MSSSRFSCPNCAHEIEITEVIRDQVKAGLELDFERDKASAIQNAIAVELEAAKKEQKKAVETEKAKVSIELADLQAQLIEKSAIAEEAQRQELLLRQKSRELEVEKTNNDLTVQRMLDEEKLKISAQIQQQMHDQFDLQLKQKEKLIDDLRKSVDEVKRRSEVGSQEAQGEALELSIEDILSTRFPFDHFSAVQKGVSGADLIQRVFNQQQQECGSIIWEAKNTKRWSKAWIEKLKDDQRQSGASFAILVSTSLPDEIDRFGQLEGVWVSDVHSYPGLATALREHLVALQFSQLAAQGKNEKVEQIYHYLSGGEFKQRVEAIVDSFNHLQEQLFRERRAMEKIWKDREKQIMRITQNTVSMYGEMQGIIGSGLPVIPALELDDEQDV